MLNQVNENKSRTILNLTEVKNTINQAKKVTNLTGNSHLAGLINKGESKTRFGIAFLDAVSAFPP